MFAQKCDDRKMIGFVYDNRQPFDLFNKDMDLVRMSLEKVFQKHILKYHEYKSLNDRRHQSLSFEGHQYMVVKSVFDDTFDSEHIKNCIIETIVSPTFKMVKQMEDNRYLAIKWLIEFIIYIIITC